MQVAGTLGGGLHLVAVVRDTGEDPGQAGAPYSLFTRQLDVEPAGGQDLGNGVFGADVQALPGAADHHLE